EVVVLGSLDSTDNDKAYLMGSGKIEQFRGGSMSSSMESRDTPDGPLWFRVTALNVKAVYGAGKGGVQDVADFFGDPGVPETYTQRQRYGRLGFPDMFDGSIYHLTRAFRFDQYRMLASDALDVAVLSDTSKSDNLSADAT